MDWDAAVFHWERCQQKPESRKQKVEIGPAATVRQPGEKQKAEISTELRLAYARQAARGCSTGHAGGDSRWSRILPRPPWALPEMLDLTSFYTLPFGEPGGGAAEHLFRGLASGVQILGGTGFDVRGIIHLKLTNHVTIPVGRACQRLHFLHAASRAAFNREKAGSYEVTYASGRTAVVDLLNPDDVPPFTSDRFHEIAALSRTNASGLRRELCLVWLRPWPGKTERDAVPDSCDLGPANRPSG